MNKTITYVTFSFSATAVQVETGDVFSDIANWFENDFVDFWEEDFVDFWTDDFVDFWEDDFVNFWEEDFVNAFEDLGHWLGDAFADYSDFIYKDIFGMDMKEVCSSLHSGTKLRGNLPNRAITYTADWIEYFIINKDRSPEKVFDDLFDGQMTYH